MYQKENILSEQEDDIKRRKLYYLFIYSILNTFNEIIGYQSSKKNVTYYKKSCEVKVQTKSMKL